MRNTKFGRKWTLKKLQRKGGQKEASGGRFWRLLEANLGVQERKIEVQEGSEKTSNFKVSPGEADPPQNTCPSGRPGPPGIVFDDKDK